MTCTQKQKIRTVEREKKKATSEEKNRVLFLSWAQKRYDRVTRRIHLPFVGCCRVELLSVDWKLAGFTFLREKQVAQKDVFDQWRRNSRLIGAAHVIIFK